MISGPVRRTRLVIRLPPAVPRARIPALSRSIRGAIDRSRPAEIVCDASALRTVDMAAVDLLARIRLAAAPRDAPMVVRDAPAELCELVELCGLSAVLGLAPSPSAPAPGASG